jgi:pyruvate formate lyase activating enzyme
MRYSIHDGPGIRTTVFFKGCPLSCKWCHNPESLNPEPQKIFNPAKCIHCGRCAGAADYDNCPTGARETIGYEINSAALMREIAKDLPFYEQSRGGVPFSGGEPLYQADFLLNILTQCRKEYINTAIDTSGFCDTGALLAAAELADYILYDIKFSDPRKHEQYCGASNELILKNLKLLSETKVKLLIRIPVIPSINDDLSEMTGIYEYIKPFTNIETVHILPYHSIHSDKYKKLGKDYELSDISGADSSNINEIIQLFGGTFPTKVGG